MQTIPDTQEQLAPRLRWAITRMARRLRQQAGTDLGPSQVAALATVERHGPLSPSELAQVDRIRRNPHVAAPNVRVPVSETPGTAPVYPISRTLERFNDFWDD